MSARSFAYTQIWTHLHSLASTELYTYLGSDLLNSSYKPAQRKLSFVGRDPFDRYYAAKSEATPALGSSGAVSSIVIFDILMAPTATVLIYGIFPVHAWILGGLFLYSDLSGAFGVLLISLSEAAHPSIKTTSLPSLRALLLAKEVPNPSLSIFSGHFCAMFHD